MAVLPEGESLTGNEKRKTGGGQEEKRGVRGNYIRSQSVEKSSSVGSIDFHPGYAHGPEEWQGHNGWGPHLEDSEKRGVVFLENSSGEWRRGRRGGRGGQVISTMQRLFIRLCLDRSEVRRKLEILMTDGCDWNATMMPMESEDVSDSP
ncbi:hypothetical protein IFM46972_02913 [Aspergillus udagawae]|uniref:Uncharacterized protein n=1 Tax=Aspergillus udagawae TaxID=91492 RepID=A0A8H3NE95_9EURO|nr:hypothetical protein IFM46972_02913 [Aspergillus udagawae]